MRAPFDIPHSVKVTAKRAWRAIRRAMRAAKTLARDARLPKWLRVLMVLMFIPIPGPFDEIVALIAFGITWTLYRPILREAWESSRERHTHPAHDVCPGYAGSIGDPDVPRSCQQA